MSILALLACAPDPAPEDLDGLVHLFWAEFDSADGERLAEAAANLPVEPSDGEITRLVADEIEHVATDPVETAEVDVSKARGWYVSTRYECTLDALEPILYELDQASQYPDAGYDSYTREYTTPLDDFTSGASETLSWDVVIEGAYLNTGYTEHLLGGLRRSGDVLMARTWIPEPVVFEEGSDWSWPQDYQIEVWIEDGSELVHLYGIWRELDVGITTENDGLVNTTMDGMRDWDDATAELCR